MLLRSLSSLLLILVLAALCSLPLPALSLAAAPDDGAVKAASNEQAAPPTPTPPAAPALGTAGADKSGAAAIDWTQATAFLDGLVEAQLAAKNIPGASLAVVKDGEIVTLRGYGHADLEKMTPVDPNKTLFRAASVSKLLVWTALMQLVEAGKIDLAADVNTYLKTFQVQAAFSKPVTAADMLTHTPGFEERSIGIEARSPEDLTPLGQALAETQPRRVYAPGKTPAYSNWSAALAGRLIESISGVPYEQYIEENIFKPLGMAHATFRQPLPEAWRKDMALGYSNEDGVRRAQQFEYIQLSPAGSMSATAADMAAFMLAHLQKGRFGDKRILKEETANVMHSRHFGLDERVSGAAYGFYEWIAQGRRLLTHEGDTTYFHSLLALYPDKGLGLYLSFNGHGGETARRQIVQAFLDRYFPIKGAETPAPAGAAGLVTDLEGWYASSRVAYSTIDSVLRLLQQVKVSAQKDGSFTLAPLCGPATWWTPAGPRLYRQKDGKELVAFYPKEGPVEGFSFNAAPSVAVLKTTNRIDTPPLQYGLLAACFLVFLSGYLSWPIVYWARRGENPRRQYVPAQAAWLAVGAGLLFAIFFALLVTVVFADMKNGLFWYMRIILAMPYLALLLSAVMTGLWCWALFGETMSRKPKRWSQGGRIHYLLILAACAGLLWFLRHWGLLWLPF